VSLVGLALLSVAHAAAAPAKLEPAPTPLLGATNIVEPAIPESVFNVPQDPSQGRNPFFPDSTAGFAQAPKPVTNAAPKALEITGLTLNGITPLGPKRTAMINYRTFEPGEEGEIKLPKGGRLLIKCLEIRNDTVLISIGSERRELSLRKGL
jgi:hypothetical protein